jgi:DnaJ like chaperone protein
MNINKWLWGGLGWAVGGPIGAIMGYAIGSMSSRNGNYSQTRGGDFGAAMLILFAAVMKADNELKKSELEFVKRFLVENFGTNYTRERMELFKKILDQNIDITTVCNQIKTNMDINSKIQLIHVLFGLSKSDNDIHISELKIITKISNLIGVKDLDFQSIKAMFIEDTKSAYKILGLDSNVDNSQIKDAYRKMAVKYHPDKVSHLGDDFSKIAEEKFKSINDAYQKIKKERNI